MPTGSLPESAKKLWERVYNDAKAAGDSEEKAAKKAWGAVKNAGWKKDAEGKWHKKAVHEMSLTIKRAWVDSKTNEKRWRADTSNTDDDKANDNMTLELFNSFIDRIESGELVPEEYRSDYWQGGMPYLSVSHYSDLDGFAVPGPVDAVYVDGKYLKAKGRFSDTRLGNACWLSVCEDLERIKRGEPFEDKVRVSIAFLDYKHIHKYNGFEFTRTSIDDVCPECLLSIIRGERPGGRSFIDGHLIHFAMTRVPMNDGTDFEPDMEVERSMTTRKEDALSIIKDEDLVEEIDAKAKLIGKSEALVIKAKCPKCGKEMGEGHECEEDEEEEKKSEAVEETMPEPVVVENTEIAELKALVMDLRSSLQKPVDEPKPHVLDDAIAQLKADFDQIILATGSADEKLQMIQQPYTVLGERIIEVMRSATQVVEEPSPQNDLVKALSEVMKPIADKLDLVLAQSRSDIPSNVPARRSIPPALAAKSETISSTTGVKSIREIAQKSVGLTE